jgi:regulator of replication initiation timing
MSETLSAISQVEQKVAKLVKNYEQLQKKYQALLTENNLLEEKLKQEQANLEEIQNKSINLQLSKQIESGGESAELIKNKIDILLEEIDKCLAALNS